MVKGDAFRGSYYVKLAGPEGNSWKSDPVSFKPGSLYEICFSARMDPYNPASSGIALVSTNFATLLIQMGQFSVCKWKDYTVQILAPTSSEVARSPVLLGEYQLNGYIDFDNVRIKELYTDHLTSNRFTLGEGKSVNGKVYKFNAPLEMCKAVSNPLYKNNAVFHDNRWRFAESGNYLVFRHCVGSELQREAKLQLDVWFHEETIFDAPVSSIRWEAIRDGIEDYEYLSILKRLITEKKITLQKEELKKYEDMIKTPSSISSSLTSYTQRPEPILKRRAEIARAIEALSK